MKFFGKKLNPRDLIDLTDSFIKPVPEMIELLAKLREQDIPIALCSNNNVFWFARQWNKCGLDRYLEAGRAILSCDHGVTKADESGLLFHRAIAVSGLEPAALLYTDDRQANLVMAQKFGLQTALFELGSREQEEQLNHIQHFLLGATDY